MKKTKTKSSKKDKTYHKLKRSSRSPFVIIVLLVLAVGFLWATRLVSADRGGDPREFHRGIVTISFVNGYKEQFKIAKDLLKPKGIDATFYVPTKNVGKKGYLSLKDLTQLKKLGFEIGNMTAEDKSLAGLTKSQILKRYQQAQTWLTDNTSGSPKTCLYPKSPYSNDNSLPSAVLDAVTKKSLGFKGCVIGHESVMFKETYDEWKLQSIFVDQRVGSYELIHLLRNVAGGHTWANFRIGQIDVRHDGSDSFTTTQILSPVFNEMVTLRTDKWIYTANVAGGINLAKREY